MATDVTDLVRFSGNDEEYLAIDQCVCGATFYPWDFQITIDEKNIGPESECNKCGRRFYFRNKITVYCVNEKNKTGFPPSRE